MTPTRRFRSLPEPPRGRTRTLLVMAAVLTTVGLAVPTLYAAAPPSADPAWVDVPATDERGLVAMVLLILMASTAALYGGASLQRLLEPYAAALTRRRKRHDGPRGPKNKVKRRKFRPVQRSRAPRQPHRVSRRICLTSQSKKRRDGPGCRG